MKKKSRILLALLTTLYMMCVMAGCAPATKTQQNAEQYIDPVYPPHYEIVYRELFGADLDTVVEKLGYAREDFSKVEDVLPYYRTEKTVTYLGQEFQVELHFYDPEAGANLGRVTLRKELTGTPEEQAKLAVEIGETLKKIFGQHPEKRDEEKEKLFVLDEALFEEWFAGMEDKDRIFSMRLTDDVAHIPENAMPSYYREHKNIGLESVSVQLKYWLSYYPSTEVPPTLCLSYSLELKHDTEFVRNES